MVKPKRCRARSRVESPEAKRPRRVGHAWYKAVKEHITGMLYVLKINYPSKIFVICLIQVQSWALGHIQIQIHQYTYTVLEITQFIRIKYNHPSKRGYPEKDENTRLVISECSVKIPESKYVRTPS